MSQFKPAMLIARHDLRLILGRREGLLWTFVMPVIFFYFLGVATAGLGTGPAPASISDPILFDVPPDSGVLVDEIARRLEEQNFHVVRPSSEIDAEAFARRLIWIPPLEDPPASGQTLTAWAMAGNTLRFAFDERLEGPDAAFDRLRVARAVYTVLADVVVISLNATSESLDAASFEQLRAMPRALTLDVSPAGRRDEPPTGFAQAVPGTMVMFTMLLLSTAGAIHLVIERNQGLLRRLASAPVSRTAIIAGKLGARVLFAMIQIGFSLVAGVVLFDIDWGPSLPMVLAVLVAWAVFNAALSLVFGNLSRTEGQAMGIGMMGTLVLAALGGAWWPSEITPDWMQNLAVFLPTGWAMDAMHKLVNFAYPPAVALPHMAAMLAASLILVWLGVRTLRYDAR